MAKKGLNLSWQINFPRTQLVLLPHLAHVITYWLIDWLRWYCPTDSTKSRLNKMVAHCTVLVHDLVMTMLVLLQQWLKDTWSLKQIFNCLSFLNNCFLCFGGSPQPSGPTCLWQCLFVDFRKHSLLWILPSETSPAAMITKVRHFCLKTAKFPIESTLYCTGSLYFSWYWQRDELQQCTADLLAMFVCRF